MKKLLKNDLLNAIAAKSGLTKADGEKFLEAFAAAVVEKTDEGLAVPVQGLGVFKPLVKKARAGRNPQTGETLQIPASRTIAFKAATAVVKQA